jgi:hypothetical protein
MSKRKPVFPNLSILIDTARTVEQPSGGSEWGLEFLGMCDAELRAAEAVIRTARVYRKAWIVGARHYPSLGATDKFGVARALSRLDRLTKGGER